jgi:hypothetical protein
MDEALPADDCAKLDETLNKETLPLNAEVEFAGEASLVVDVLLMATYWLPGRLVRAHAL